MFGIAKNRHVFAKKRRAPTRTGLCTAAASASASSFVVHHTQQISMAAVAGDEKNSNKQHPSRTDDVLYSSSPQSLWNARLGLFATFGAASEAAKL